MAISVVVKTLVINMFKELRQRIGQGLTPNSGRSSVAHGQVGRAVMTVYHFIAKFGHRDTMNRMLTAASNI